MLLHVFAFYVMWPETSPQQGTCARSAGFQVLQARNIGSCFAMAAEEATFQVQDRKVIFYGKDEWCPNQKKVGDRTFFSFTKWCPQLTFMLTGKRLRLDSTRAEQSGSLNVPIIHKIIEVRQEACDKAFVEAMKVDDASEDEEPQKKRKTAKIVRKASAKDLHLIPEIMEVTVGDFQLALLSEGLMTTTIWMELRPENLSWLKSCVQAEEALPRQKREPKAMNPEGEEAKPRRRKRESKPKNPN